MISIEYAQALANYSREMNLRLYACSATLTDEQRKRDVGAFFKSIHGTLNHLLLGDRVWMGRFIGKPFAVQSLGQELYGDFAELRSERERTDAAIATWVNELTTDMLAGDLSYTSISTPTPKRMPLWFVVTHFFNHGTHHRGQVTALLKQLGVDPGVTDLIAFPLGGSR
jgi:uncharacterized damage-inducible protein DinB